jgi:hypothetical protein
MNMLDNSLNNRRKYLFNKTNNNSGHVDIGLNNNRLRENQSIVCRWSNIFFRCEKLSEL